MALILSEESMTLLSKMSIQEYTEAQETPIYSESSVVLIPDFNLLLFISQCLVANVQSSFVYSHRLGGKTAFLFSWKTGELHQVPEE